MAKWTLSPPRDLPWALRDLHSAKQSVESDAAGRLIMRIEHAPLVGLTPADLVWWFGNIGGGVTIGGQSMARYLAWHPTDHIHWALHRPGPNGRAELGAQFHIVEAFGANMDYLIDVTETVVRLDSSGITLEKRLAGQVVTQLSHDFGDSDLGATYRSTMIVGFATIPLPRVANALLHRFVFSSAMGHAWIRHNIEEVGLLAHIVPLARAQDGRKGAPPGR